MRENTGRVKQKAAWLEAALLLQTTSYLVFLLVSDFIFEVSAIFIFEVSVDILEDVSVVIVLVVVSGVTAVESLADFDSPLLLQAARVAAIIAIAKNFFILRFCDC